MPLIEIGASFNINIKKKEINIKKLEIQQLYRFYIDKIALLYFIIGLNQKNIENNEY